MTETTDRPTIDTILDALDWPADTRPSTPQDTQRLLLSLRRDMLRAMRAELNLWMGDYGHTAYHVPQALIDGRLTEEILAAYPADDSYPEQLSRAIAHQAGMVFADDPESVNDDGWRMNVDSEAVGFAIEALRGLMAGEAEIHAGIWSFYPENLELHGLTIERVRVLMRYYATDLTEAAGLLMAAHAVPLAESRGE